MSQVARRDDGVLTLKEDASTSDKISYAHSLRLSGKSWREIADLCSYASDDSARLQVSTWIQKAALEVDKTTRSEHLALELERLDALLVSVWDTAMTGDKAAVDSACKIVQLRSRILGLDNITAEVNNNVQTIVVTQEEYINRLKVIAGSNE